MKNACPCYSGKAYADCCEPLHHGADAADAERLMRARYSAYALRLPDYIVRTWHPDSRPQNLSMDELSGLKWLKLQVLSHRQIDSDHAEVSFIATYQSRQQKKATLSEHSTFVRIAHQWLYQGELAD